MAIFIRLFSSIRIFGRCRSLYKLPLQVMRDYKKEYRELFAEVQNKTEDITRVFHQLARYRPWEKFHQYGHIWGLYHSSHEKNNIWMSQPQHYLNLNQATRRKELKAKLSNRQINLVHKNIKHEMHAKKSSTYLTLELCESIT